MIAENPSLGVGWGNAGKIFENWYQPLDMAAHYHSLINSYLTLAAELGLPVLVFAFSLLLFPLLGMNQRIDLAENHDVREVWLNTGRAGLLAFLVASFFNYSLNKGWLPLALLPWAALVFFLVRETRKPWAKMAWAMGFSIFIVLAMFWMGKRMLARDPWIRSFQRTAEGRTVTIHPRNQLPHETLRVRITGPVWGTEPGKRVRELASAGFKVVALMPNAEEARPSETVDVEWLDSSSPSRARGLFFLAPSEGTAIRRAMEEKHVPVLIIAAELDERMPLPLLRATLKKQNNPPPLIVIESVGEDFGLKWKEVVAHIRAFVSAGGSHALEAVPDSHSRPGEPHASPAGR